MKELYKVQVFLAILSIYIDTMSLPCDRGIYLRAIGSFSLMVELKIKSDTCPAGSVAGKF